MTTWPAPYFGLFSMLSFQIMMHSAQQTIVLIHGFGFDQRIWDPVELAFDGFDVIRLSLPGFGSDTPMEPYSIEQLADQFWEIIDGYGKENIHLVGHSMGGYVCIEMAARQPDRILSLALVHSHVYQDSQEKKQQRTTTMEGIKRDGRKPLVYKMIPSLFAPDSVPEIVVKLLMDRGMQYADEAWYFGTQAMRDRHDHAATLASIKVPVLIVAGEKDNAVPDELAYKMTALTERVLLSFHPDVGHMAMYEDSAALICDLVNFYHQ